MRIVGALNMHMKTQPEQHKVRRPLEAVHFAGGCGTGADARVNQGQLPSSGSSQPMTGAPVSSFRA
jgi:hypothetical protein